MVACTVFASLFAGAVIVSAGSSTYDPIPGNCDVSHVHPFIPPNQNNVSAPSGEHPFTIAFGVGVQNYTCTDAGAYSSVGALAELSDITCLHGSPLFDAITSIVFNFWNASSSITTADVVEAFAPQYPHLGQHYFATNPFTGTGLNPVFDFRATSRIGDPNAFTLMNKTGDIPAPTGTQDVDWLELTSIQGSLAKHVLRLDTRFGQPPKTCTPGSPLLSVKYTAQYWFYN
ncbi:hypothetical protein M0805_005045 [Coniferiporia weirii]|nr:hypothetical protein M0805_005045 [Coniferiporia weirii]